MKLSYVAGILLGMKLAALEQQYRHLAQIEVDEVARLVGHIRTKVTTHDAMPCRIVLLVKFLLYVRSNILRTEKTF